MTRPRGREILPRPFPCAAHLADDRPAPLMTDPADALTWCEIPRGSFVQGFSMSERERLRELAPRHGLKFGGARDKQVSAFVMTERPLSIAQVRIAGVTAAGPDDAIAMLGRGDAERVAVFYRAALPSETQWEYACRGRTQTLFWWGDEPPRDPALISRLVGHDPRPLRNAFGLARLFDGEWCDDRWRTPTRSLPASWVIRGGAGRRFPWTDAEGWVGCACAYRVSSDEVDGVAAVRLARSPHPFDHDAEPA